MSRRNQSGRFAGNANRESFDLVRSVRALFRAAEKSGDYAGAASLARVLRDLDPGPEPESSATYDVVKQMLWTEEEDLRVHMLGCQRVLNAARKRLGIPEVPISENLLTPIKVPEPRVVHPNVYLPQPAPRAKAAAADDEPAAASQPVAVDPLDGYIAGEGVEFGEPEEVFE